MFKGLFRKHAPHRLEGLGLYNFLQEIKGNEAQVWVDTFRQYEGQAKSVCDNRLLPVDMCMYCGSSGHWSRECPQAAANRASQARCDICRGTGHTPRTCPQYEQREDVPSRGMARRIRKANALINANQPTPPTAPSTKVQLGARPPGVAHALLTAGLSGSGSSTDARQWIQEILAFTPPRRVKQEPADVDFFAGRRS